jgi:hypothetical protein
MVGGRFDVVGGRFDVVGTFGFQDLPINLPSHAFESPSPSLTMEDCLIHLK